MPLLKELSRKLIPLATGKVNIRQTRRRVPNNPLGLGLGGLPDVLPTVLRAERNPKSEVRRPTRPVFDIAICHLKASGSVYSPRRGARYERGTRHARDRTGLNRNSIKPCPVSGVSMHWPLQGLNAVLTAAGGCLSLRNRLRQAAGHIRRADIARRRRRSSRLRAS